MSLRIPLLLLPLLLACATAVHAAAPNRYRIVIGDDAATAEVEADVELPTPALSMFGIQPTATLPNGQADLIRGLAVRDAAGAPVAVAPLGEGDYRLDRAGRVRVSYRVALEHDRHAWPMGAEEVAYRTPEGLMVAVQTLLLAASDGQQGEAEVEFVLPKGWQARTPWRPLGGMRFAVPTRRELLSNVVFLGTSPARSFRAGGIEMTLVLGARYRPAAPMFEDLLRRQLDAYAALFGGPPRNDRYLIVVNQGPDDGGAFASSFSQFIRDDADPEGRLIWGTVMAHELLHFWNGLSMQPADAREEWFKEGVTDYLTMTTLARSGQLDEAQLHWRLENIVRRVLLARQLQRLDMGVREAGRDKQAHRQLVYGGGAFAALALDVELRRCSGERVGLPDLVRSMYREFGDGTRGYTVDDVAVHAGRLCAGDWQGLLATLVTHADTPDMRPWLAALGLRLDTLFYDEVRISAARDADAIARARYRAVFH